MINIDLGSQKQDAKIQKVIKEMEDFKL